MNFESVMEDASVVSPLTSSFCTSGLEVIPTSEHSKCSYELNPCSSDHDRALLQETRKRVRGENTDKPTRNGLSNINIVLHCSTLIMKKFHAHVQNGSV